MIALYVTFIVHFAAWFDRLHYSIVSFEKKAQDLTLEQVFHHLLTELLKVERDHLEDILKFLATHTPHLAIMGVKISRPEIQEFIQFISEHKDNLPETIFLDIASRLHIDPSICNKATTELFLKEMEKSEQIKNWFSRSFLNKFWSNVKKVSSQVRKDIGLGTWELTFLAFTVTVILILFVIFLVYGFNQVTHTSIGLSL